MAPKLKILLVEDNEGDYLIVEEYLREVFLDVLVEHSWLLSEAKKSLISTSFDIILFDLSLPDSNGKESVKEILELANSAPVIVLTGYADKKFAIDTMQMGVQDYLIKDEVNPVILQKSISYSIERNKIQLLFQKNEKKFKSIVENSADGYALIQVDGKVCDLSPYGKARFNFNPIDEQGYFRTELIHSVDRSTAIKTFFEVAKQPGDIRSLELKYQVGENNFRWIETTLYNLLEEPSVNAVVLNYRDITLRKHEEEQHLALIEELLQSNADLKQFGFITTHNLRAPLTNLLAIVELLDLNKIPDHSSKELLVAFKTATFQLNDTLNDLIKVLFIKQNKNVALGQVDFKTVLERNIHDLRTLIKSSEISIETNFFEAPTIYFDAKYLESILLNLMSNAIKFSSSDRKLQVKITTRKEGEYIVLEFSDNGIGMDMEKVKDRIFGLYQRFHERADSKGIGLYLIHSQVTALGGKISVQSKVNEGTTFYIQFKQSQNNSE